MDTKKVFEETCKLDNEIGRLHRQLDSVNMKILGLMEACPHEIVFKYTDNHPRKALIDGSYYCPACGKQVNFVVEGQELPFKTSRIIPLTNLSLVDSSDLYYTIRSEVYMNMDFYYNPDTPIEELASSMELLLEDKQTKYEKTGCANDRRECALIDSVILNEDSSINEDVDDHLRQFGFDVKPKQKIKKR